VCVCVCVCRAKRLRQCHEPTTLTRSCSGNNVLPSSLGPSLLSNPFIYSEPNVVVELDRRHAGTTEPLAGGSPEMVEEDLTTSPTADIPLTPTSHVNLPEHVFV
jgi:hypothetical protein